MSKYGHGPWSTNSGAVGRKTFQYKLDGGSCNGNDVGSYRAEIQQGIREVVLRKDQDRKIGLRLESVDNGIFVQPVQANSPASLVGLRFETKYSRSMGRTVQAGALIIPTRCSNRLLEIRLL